jgi:cytochrome c biogenesis protein CcmG/thiol:disulfide interchange protein DsbE
MKRILPIVIFIGLFVFLAKSLFQPQTNIPSPLIGKPIPPFSLSELNSDTSLTDNDILGNISLINVWATWCVGCDQEHGFLVELAANQDIHIPIIGINWKDRDDLALRWLSKRGDPYTVVLSDPIGKTAIDFGVYGAPETFLIDEQGVIHYKHIGPLSREVFTINFMPIIKELRR